MSTAVSRVDLGLASVTFASQRYYSPLQSSLKLTFDSNFYRFHPGFGEIRPISTRVASHQVTSKDLFEHFFGTDGRSGIASKWGIRPVFGDNRDDTIKAEAEAAFEESQYQADLAMKIAHMDRVNKERASEIPVSPPSPETMAAMKRIKDREEKLGRSMAFACQHCAWPSATEDERKAHVYSFHPEKAGALTQHVPAAGEPAPEPMELRGLSALSNIRTGSPDIRDAQIAELTAKLEALAEAVATMPTRGKPGPKPKTSTE